MPKFIIEYGCGMGQNTVEIIEAVSLDSAADSAYYAALDEIQSYEGLHGIPSLEECDGDEEAHSEELEGWLHYHAVPFDPKNPGHVALEKDGDEGIPIDDL